MIALGLGPAFAVIATGRALAQVDSVSASASASASLSSPSSWLGAPAPSDSAHDATLTEVPQGGLSASASPRPLGPSDVTSTIAPGDLAAADSFLPPDPGPRENFVPDLLRAPDVTLAFDLSTLLRVSPRDSVGTIPEAPAHGFRTDVNRVPIGSGGVLLGVGAGMSIVWGNRFIFPAISMDFAHSLGARGRVLSGEAGAVLSAETWSTFQFGATLLGVGVRGRHRQWAGSLLLEPGFVGQSTNIRTPVYEGEASWRAQAFSPRLLLTATGCRRIDPTLRICLSASPHVYALGFGNGFTLGFRTEVGP